jgi:hypothetical protein
MNNSKSSRVNNSKSSRAPIEPATCYPLANFQLRVGFGDSAMRAARKAGLKVLYLHKRPFVFGGDFIEYLKLNGSDNSRETEAGE